MVDQEIPKTVCGIVRTEPKVMTSSACRCGEGLADADQSFDSAAAQAAQLCPISVALAGTNITLDTRLEPWDAREREFSRAPLGDQQSA
jgi:hypothetical protein